LASAGVLAVWLWVLDDSATGNRTACDSRAVGKLLVVDDEQSMREFLAICLRRAGHEVVSAKSGTEAIERLRDQPIDLVITDLKMPGELDGLGLLHAIKGGTIVRPPVVGAPPAPIDPEVILVTAFATADTALAAMKKGAYDYLTKPFLVD
jgi:two-component system, NtrC family, response regulator PilR